jgi:hypothetical protein
VFVVFILDRLMRKHSRESKYQLKLPDYDEMLKIMSLVADENFNNFEIMKEIIVR